MRPTPELLEDLYRERVLRARAMTPEQKLLAGLDLFDLTCRIMSDGIRAQVPNADNAQVLAILRQRLDAVRRRQEPS